MELIRETETNKNLKELINSDVFIREFLGEAESQTKPIRETLKMTQESKEFVGEAESQTEPIRETLKMTQESKEFVGEAESQTEPIRETLKMTQESKEFVGEVDLQPLSSTPPLLQDMTLKNEDPMFTRFLYYKNDVVLSFIICILKKDIEQSLFWGYELYYSGFKTEIIEILLFIYEKFYELYNSKKIKIFIENKMIEFLRNINKYYIIATLIHNIITRPSKINKNNGKKIYKIIYVIYINNDPLLEKYKEEIIIRRRGVVEDEADTGDAIVCSPYNLLKYACKYSTIKDNTKKNFSRKELREKYFYNWEYYSFNTPIWNERFLLYNGIIDHENKIVVFNDEELEELFYNKYGYEPDEQPREITERTIGYDCRSRVEDGTETRNSGVEDGRV